MQQMNIKKTFLDSKEYENQNEGLHDKTKTKPPSDNPVF